GIKMKNNYSETHQYFIDLDISAIDRQSIERVIDNIAPFVTRLANCKSTVDKLKIVLSKSSTNDLIKLTKNISIDKMIFNGCGSRILEIFIERFTNDNLILQIKNDFLDSLYRYFNSNLKMVLNDCYSTHVLRKLFEHFHINLKLTYIDFESEHVLNTIITYLKVQNNRECQRICCLTHKKKDEEHKED
ncbi:putative Armadillo-type fold, Pumilio RNA-binding repeat protein, partial [Pseudoloma neurophilia]